MAHVETSQISQLTNALPLVSKTTDGNVGTQLITGTVEVGALAVSDTVAICRLPQNCKVTELVIGNDSLGTTLTVDLGVYQPTETSSALGTAIDADCFTSTSMSLASAALTRASTHMASDVINEGKRLWELAGLSVPNPDYADMTLGLNTVTSGTPTAGTLRYRVEYTV